MKNCPKCNHDLGIVLGGLRLDTYLRCANDGQIATQENIIRCESCLAFLEIKSVSFIKTETTISVKEAVYDAGI